MLWYTTTLCVETNPFTGSSLLSFFVFFPSIRQDPNQAAIVVQKIQDLRARNRIRSFSNRLSVRRDSNSRNTPSLTAISTWQPTDVADWLRTADLEDMESTFLSAHINGSKLLALMATDLVNLGINVSLADRKRPECGVHVTSQ